MAQPAESLLPEIVHDLRSPLAVIAGTAATLRELVPEEARPGIDRIASEAHRIGRMLENRVAELRVVAGAAVNREWITLQELASGALARVETILGDRRVRLAIDDDAIAHVDPRMIELVVVNLFDNAARHGGGVIGMLGARTERGVVIEVSDAGSATDAPVISAPGRGLAVCRAIVNAHGGSLEIVENKPGTTVRIRLPHGEPRPAFESAVPNVASKVSSPSSAPPSRHSAAEASASDRHAKPGGE